MYHSISLYIACTHAKTPRNVRRRKKEEQVCTAPKHLIAACSQRTRRREQHVAGIETVNGVEHSVHATGATQR